MDIMASWAKASFDQVLADARSGQKVLFHVKAKPTDLKIGDRVWIVSGGYLRGFSLASGVIRLFENQSDYVTGRTFKAGWFVLSTSDTWKWIQPVGPMKMIRGYQYMDAAEELLNRVCGTAKDEPPPNPPKCQRLISKAQTPRYLLTPRTSVV